MGSVAKEGPAIRRRFVARAATLKLDPAFLANIDRARRAWDRTYPAFPVPALGQMPDPAPTIAFACVPPALERIKRGQQEGGVPPRGDASPAWDRWERLVLRFCADWWPARWSYHNWRGGGQHPATLFVSACLLWGPASVPPEAIIAGGLIPSPLPYDPNDPNGHPTAIYWQTFAGILLDALRATADSGHPISHEWVGRVGVKAMHDATLAHKATMDRFDETTAHWVVPVYPGFSTSDRDVLAGWVKDVADLRFGTDPVGQHARDLAAHGWTPRRIADALGVSDDTVRRSLKAAT